jgi:hypothetical protein
MKLKHISIVENQFLLLQKLCKCIKVLFTGNLNVAVQSVVNIIRYLHMSLAQERKGQFAYNRKFTKIIEQRVRSYLEQEQWSPEQIVGHCKKQGIEMVSVERIYQFIRQNKA